MADFTHFDESGNAVMVDVTEKKVTTRVAIAEGTIFCNKEIIEAILAKNIKKGDVLGVARVAGVSIALLTIYDMCKAVDKRMVISDIHLVEKHGGKSADFYFDEEK